MRAILLLILAWLALSEDISIPSLLVGFVIAGIALFASRKALTAEKVTGLKFGRLAWYPFFLIGQVYLAGFSVIQLIFKGGVAKVVKAETTLKNEFLVTVLSNSITLTPGTIFLEQEGSELTVLCLIEDKDDVPDVTGALEDMLIRIQ